MATFTAHDMSKIKVKLLHQFPFFGSLGLRLEYRENPNIPTARTNGTWVEYNPAFFAGMSDPERRGVVVHEIAHCAFLHMFRRGSRDLRLWNEAADYAINPMVLAAGLALPKGVLLDARFKGMGAEQIYAILLQEKQQKNDEQKQAQQSADQGGKSQGGSGEGDGEETESSPEGDSESGDSGEPDSGNEPGSGQGQGGNDCIGSPGTGTDATKPGDVPQTPVMGDCPTGDFVDGKKDAEGGKPGDMNERDWQIAVSQAVAVAKAAGKLPGGWAESLEELRKPVMDPWGILDQFVAQTMVTDTSWTTPNRRLVASGVYLPGAFKDNVGEMVFALDTSASCTTEMLKIFGGHMVGILQTYKPEKVHIISCDTRVTDVTTLDPDQFEDFKLECKGRGGTAFQPVFDKVEELGIDPVCMIYLTDLEGPKPVEPSYPVLWAIPEAEYRQDAWFGETIKISAE